MRRAHEGETHRKPVAHHRHSRDRREGLKAFTREGLRDKGVFSRRTEADEDGEVEVERREGDGDKEPRRTDIWNKFVYPQALLARSGPL